MIEMIIDDDSCFQWQRGLVDQGLSLTVDGYNNNDNINNNGNKIDNFQRLRCW